MKVLYYDCFSGISGDMNLGAMLDLGVDQELLLEELGRLNLEEEYSIDIHRETKQGISGTRVEIQVKHEHGTVAHNCLHARNLKSISRLLEESSLSVHIKARSLKMFTLLAEAEAKVHGVDIDEIHFHEVGATDAILDIVGAAFCLEYLQVDKVISSSVELGGGFVRCEHGLLPVPAPAVIELLDNVPVKLGRVQYETTTPTGAVILAAGVQEYADRIDFKIMKTGYGIGKRDLEIPNVLRVYLGETIDVKGKDKDRESEAKEFGFAIGHEYIIETNIDDMNPEYYEYIEEKLFAVGALDTFKTPLIMKKGRPGIKLSVLVTKENMPKIEEVIFRETSAIGSRTYQVEKKMLSREIAKVSTKFGLISVKYSYFGETTKVKPEYEDCKRLAKENNVTLTEVYEEIHRLINRGQN